MERITITLEREGRSNEYGCTAEKITNEMALAFLAKAPRILELSCTCRDVAGRCWSCDCPEHGDRYTKSKGGQS